MNITAKSERRRGEGERRGEDRRMPHAEESREITLSLTARGSVEAASQVEFRPKPTFLSDKEVFK